MCCLSSQQAVTPTEAREEVTAHCAHCIPNNTSFKLCLCQAEAPASRSPPHRCSAGKKIQQQRGETALPACSANRRTSLISHQGRHNPRESQPLVKRGLEEGTESQREASSCPSFSKQEPNPSLPALGGAEQTQLQPVKLEPDERYREGPV